MNVEDSYEGAVRRMQRLEVAGLTMESPPSNASSTEALDAVDRMRELEELATIVCEDNDRLKGELVAASEELERARHDQEQLSVTVSALRQQLTSAQQALASAQQALASATHAPVTNAQPAVVNTQPAAWPFAPMQQQPGSAALASATHEPVANVQPSPSQPLSFAPSPFATDALPEEDFDYPAKSSRKGAFYFVVIASLGAAIAALCVLRPWDRPQAMPIPVEPPVTAPAATPAPTATTPTAAPATTTAPVVTPPPAHSEPTIPKAATTFPKASRTEAAPTVAGTRAAQRHDNQHTAKKQGTAANAKSAPVDSDDPLGGTDL